MRSHWCLKAVFNRFSVLSVDLGELRVLRSNTEWATTKSNPPTYYVRHTKLTNALAHRQISNNAERQLTITEE